MNFCAVILGFSENQPETISSLKAFDDLKIICAVNLIEVCFDNLESDYVFFVKNGDILSRSLGDNLNPPSLIFI